jgi:hypothetical protein
MYLYPNPDVAGGLLALLDGEWRIGAIEMDVHGTTQWAKFDGTRWQTWTGGTEFDPLRTYGMAQSQNGVRGWRTGFAFDPVHREGLVTVNRGGGMDQLVAEHLSLDATPSLFGRYDRAPGATGGWLATPDFDDDPSQVRRSFILDPNQDTNQYSFTASRVAHIPGTRDYVFFYQLNFTSGAPTVLGAGRYQAADTSFSWWNGSAWQPAASSTTYLAQIPTVLQGYTPEDMPAFQLATTSSDVVLLGVVGTTLQQVTYNVASGAISAPIAVCPIEAAVGETMNFATYVDGSDTLWLVSTPDRFRLDLRKRMPNGSWTAPELLYATGDDLEPVGIDMMGSQPIVLLRATSASSSRLLAIGDQPAVSWANETPLVLAPPPASGGLLNAQPGYTFDKAVAAGAPEAMTSTPLSLCTDDDGYAYATQVGLADVTVQPPGAMTSGDNHSWGDNWDYFLFPSGVAAYPEQNRVYITSNLHSGGGRTPGFFGVLSAIDLPERDHSFGFWSSNGALGPQFDPSYGPQQLGWGAYMPVGLAIDRQSGRLYMTASGTNQLLIFDVAHLQDSSEQFPRAGFGYDRQDPSRYPIIDGIVTELISAGHLAASGSNLSWEATSWPPVHATLVATSGYGQLNAGEQATLHRTIQQHFNNYHARPVYLSAFGTGGTGAGQFAFPTGLSVDGAHHLYVVDTNNHRVQKFDTTNQTPVYLGSFGSEGRGTGQLFYPQSVSAADDGAVFVTDPMNNRIVVFDASGAYLFEFSRYQDAQAMTHELTAPTAVWAGRPGYLYFNDGADVITFHR